MKNIFGKIWANRIVRHLILMVVGVPLFVFLVNFSLLIGTQHGRSFPMPDFSGLTVEEAASMAQANRLRLEVIDSVFIPQSPRGAIFRQNPLPGAQVKKNRRVLLTINSLSPRRVTVPDVTGFSLRQAKAVLQSQELEIGRLRYVPDIAANNVLRQSYKGIAIEGSLKVNAGSAIDLELGLGETGVRTVIPHITGLSAEAARDLLLDHSLNVLLRFDKTVANYTDSLSAQVYRQLPMPSQSAIWPLGTKVEVYLK